MKFYTPIVYLVFWFAKILCTLLCYLTNPIVVLFADEKGNLPKVFKLWQTYDNCLDVEWMISEEVVPKFARYNFNRYYRYHLEDKRTKDIIPGYVDILEPITSTKVKLQRYFCRVAWLYRNCAYGFAYYIFGKQIDCTKIVTVKDFYRDRTHYFIFKYVKDSYLFTIKSAWDYTIPVVNIGLQVNIYLGWKFAGYDTNSDTPQHCMVAIRCNPIASQKRS